jgi:hypothetical protein
MTELILVEKQKEFVPEFRVFRDYVNNHCQYWEKQEEIAIKLLYLLGSRASEIITKITPQQRKLNMTKPYGTLLRWEFVNYKMKNGEQAKILLVHTAIAKAGKNRKLETSPQTAEPLTTKFECSMREVPIILEPKNIEPWARDIMVWIREKGIEAGEKGDNIEKALKEALRFPIVEMTLQNWIWDCLKGLTPKDWQPQTFSRLNRIRKPIHPHSLRHWRVTHLKNVYKFNPVEQCAFVRWSVRSQEAKRGVTVSSNIDIYSQLSWTDFIDKLLVPISEVL